MRECALCVYTLERLFALIFAADAAAEHLCPHLSFLGVHVLICFRGREGKQFCSEQNGADAIAEPMFKRAKLAIELLQEKKKKKTVEFAFFFSLVLPLAHFYLALHSS